MPAQRPRAAFEPISPTFDIGQLVEQTPNFQYVDRISCEQIAENGIQAFEQLVLLHVIVGGKPLVVDGFENLLDPWTFTPKWLRDNVGSKVEQSRNLANKDYLPLSIAHYLNNMGRLTNQYFENPRNYKDKTRQRIYLKDIDCPQVWHDKLQEHIPPSLFYLNDSTGEPAGPGATIDPHSNVPGRRIGRGIARAGDLMSSLPPDMRAQNLMCYIGHEGTYTPAHREMCASMGHNIMVEASTDVGADGKPEKPGSSLWFMTESKDRNTVSEYWLSVLGHDIEVESHFAQISAWKKAPFSVYVVEQKPGDFILIPPLAPHQVWNRGTRTMKVAWNRTSVETLEMALDEALPKARIVCRDEQYKNKAIVYYTLIKYSVLLASAKDQAEKLPLDASRDLMSSHKIKQLFRDFRRLLALFKQNLLSEMFSPDGPQEKCEYLPFDSNVTCAYCRGNIFNRFLSCQSCTDALGHDEDEPYDVCMDCYAMGRSCGCISNLKWTEQFKWKELVQKYEAWRKQLIDLDGGRITAKTPLPLLDERRKLPLKTLAEVCREQLKRRPFVDPKKPKEPVAGDESEEDIIVDDQGRVKKTVKKRSKTWLKTHSPCHVCCKRHPSWKSAKCTTCERWWCYGSLFRGADMMPIDIMQDPNWSCPHCLNVCFAGNCRKDPKQTPIEPKGTLLGHDTKKVADARSVECLVDFSVSNLNWLRDDDDDAGESARIRRAREEAQRAKAIDPQAGDDDDHDDEDEETQVQFEYSPDDTPAGHSTRGNGRAMALDPALQSESDMLQSLSQANKAMPPPSAMLRGARPMHTDSPLFNEQARQISAMPSGYAPATTAGFVAPSAIMYPPSEDNMYTYPDPEDASRAERDDDSYAPHTSDFRPFQRPSKRNREAEEDDHINMDVHPKRRRVSEDPSHLSNRPRNEATLQFEREKERKALDEAKKQGRFIAVQAALKGRKRVVKLSIPGARLAQLIAAQAASQVQPVPTLDDEPQEPEVSEQTILVRSDIAPAEAKATKNVNASKLKVRMEKDEDFTMRSDRHQRIEGKRRRGHIVDYEEVEIPSDDEGDDVTAEGGLGVGASGSKNGAGGRRVSSYIQRKHQDDPELPDELPENFKDSRPGRKTPGAPRSSATTRKRTSAGDLSLGAQNSAAKSGPNASSRLSLRGPDDDTSAGALIAPSSNRDSVSIEEANRLAKLEALNMLEDGYSSSTGTQPETIALRRPLHRSIFDGKSKKKVRIVSASSGDKIKAVSRGLSGRAGSVGSASESDSEGPDVMPPRAPLRAPLKKRSIE